MAYPEIYVLRHGETEWNAEHRMQGRLNSPLTAKGIAQAERQGEIMRALGRDDLDLLCSPQGRAFQTAAIVFAHAQTITTDAKLCEIDVGLWQGRLRQELVLECDLKETPDGPLALYEHAEGGEGFVALRERCRQLLDSLPGPTALVTHGITSRMLRLVYLGWDTGRMDELPGGQGVVHHLSGVDQEILS